MNDPVRVTPQRIIPAGNSAVLHGMKSGDPGERGFGEVYFSEVAQGEVRGWKRHREMTLNIVVPRGMIRFVLIDDRLDKIVTAEYQLSRETNYQRLSVPPMVWMAFQGVGKGSNLLCNIASIPHHPDEADSLALDAFSVNWSDTEAR